MFVFNEDCLETNLEGKFDCIITDPPYFVLPKGKQNDKFQWDNFESKKHFIEFTTKWFKKYYALLEENSFMFVFWSQKYLKEGFEIFNPKRMILWHYTNLINGGGGKFAYDYEPIFVICKGSPKLKAGKHSCLRTYTKPQSNFKRDKLMHPAQKPLKLIEDLLNIIKIKPKRVLDMFAGSGTTLKACQNLNIEAVGIERDPRYFQLIRERLSETNKGSAWITELF